jgi:hypothetical protein
MALAPSEASALRTVYGAWLGTYRVFNWAGTAVAAVQPTDNRPCVFWSLGVGGLDDDVEITTSAGVEIILVMDESMSSFCGLSSLKPLVYNGHSVTVNAGWGDDFIDCGSGNCAAYGGAGNDDVYVSVSPGFGYGRGGGDTGRVYGANNYGDRLFGDGGNDALCELSFIVCTEMKGGAGTDKRCGSANSMDAPLPQDCSKCGPGWF